ncbi:MAG: ParB/RepB/Spo0J family partition protein [Planctomycetaceae bacterium]|nr:ParB/RepB/Spo0J family partition protein [Planctomycetaceae bacterium]
MSTRSHQVARIPVDRIQRSGQVREIFDEASIQQLAENIAQHGLIHPIHVHQVGETFRLIAGERRYRAVQLLGHKTILATVASGTIAEGDIVEKMLSENVSREDLNPIELAKGIKQLKELSGQTASAAATRLGLSNKMVSELLSLLSLPDSIQLDVQSGEIPVSLGAELARVSDPEEQASLAQQVIAGTMTRDRLVAQRKRSAVTRPRSEATTVQRVTAHLGAGQTVSVACGDLTLDRFIEVLDGLLRRAKQVRPRGIELPTFLKILRDEAKA